MIRIALYQLPQYREVLCHFLNSLDGFCVVGNFNQLPELAKQAHLQQPDVVLLDISVTGGVDAISVLKKFNPGLRVIVLTNTFEQSTVFKCLRYGASGYLLIGKTALPRLSDYIRDADEGGIPMSPTVMGTLFGSLTQGSYDGIGANELTKRESEVLQRLVDGLTYKEVSSVLGIALDTVRSHIKNIYEKLGVNSKSEAVVKALRDRMAIAS
jgi:DNA-binding NarL/FixJ family response regulator